MENKDQPINPTPIAGGDESVVSALDASNVKKFHQGLTKREYFAGLAMQIAPFPHDYVGKQETEESYANWADKCIKMADALLSALTVKNNHQL